MTAPSGLSPVRLNDEKRAGIFAPAGCELPLFSSAMKYDSGTGWPSFLPPYPVPCRPGAITGMAGPAWNITARCGGHQGHVFDDGPAPTRQRWCNNGVALRFPAAS